MTRRLVPEWTPEHAMRCIEHFGGVDAAVAALRRAALAREIAAPQSVGPAFNNEIARREQLIRAVGRAWEETS